MRRHNWQDYTFKSTPNPNAARALAGALVTQKHDKGSPQRGQRTGRIDSRNLHRVGTGNLEVFIRPTAKRPERIRVIILVDASGSMSGGNDNLAQQTCRNLADAMTSLEHIHGTMYAFTTGMGGCVLYDLWETGKPAHLVDNYAKVPMSGTEEGFAIAYAIDELLEKKTPQEKALIIMISDGQPSEIMHVKAMVDLAKRNDIPVVSVALVPLPGQAAMYGKENVIEYTTSSRKLGREMAKAIGRVI